MAITLEAAVSTAAINAACDAIVDLVDAGTASPQNGYIELQTSGGTEVATLTFANPAFGAASSGTATSNSITSDTSATGNSGAVTQFEVYDSDATLLWSGAVAESGSDLNLDDGTSGGGVVIETGATVSISQIQFSIAFA